MPSPSGIQPFLQPDVLQVFQNHFREEDIPLFFREKGVMFKTLRDDGIETHWNVRLKWHFDDHESQLFLRIYSEELLAASSSSLKSRCFLWTDGNTTTLFSKTQISLIDTIIITVLQGEVIERPPIRFKPSTFEKQREISDFFKAHTDLFPKVIPSA